jgi:microcystin-dependent protein
MATRVYNGSEVKADLYARIPGDGEMEILLGDTAISDSPFSFWQYDASSSATDDFAGGVIKPTAQMSNGRWLRRGYYNVMGDWSQSTSTEQSYIQNKPTLATVAISGAYSDLTGTPTNLVPSGALFMWGTASAPIGYLLCDGTAVSRTTYAGLFAVISTAFGTGDGSTTFNVPDFRQKFPLGKSASGTGSTLAGTGGAIDHVHAADPPSTSTSTDGSHNHGGATGNPSATVAATNLTGSAANAVHTHSISTDGSHSHTLNVASFNTDTANPPFMAINFIVKT